MKPAILIVSISTVVIAGAFTTISSKTVDHIVKSCPIQGSIIGYECL